MRTWILLVLSIGAQAEIIDRVAISVGSEVITLSEVKEEVRVTAFLNSEPVQFTAKILRETGERMVDQLMIRNENVTSRFGSANDSDVTTMIDEIVRSRFQGDPTAYQAELARYELTESILKEHVRWQLTAMRYISVRFGTGVQVRPVEVEDYFKREIQPRLPPDSKATAEDYRERIETALLEERANQEADAWIKEARGRMIVDFDPEVFP